MRALLLGLSLLLSVCWPCAHAAGNTGTALSVIMAPGVTRPALTHAELALIFARKKRFWEDGLRIQPVNLEASHPLRRAFSQQVLGHSPEELEDYWRTQYFHGELPPYVLASEEAVIRFVASTPGAIGYVSHCAVDTRVVVLMQLEGSTTCPR